MPYRLKPIITDQYYHVYNRGINGMQIFKDSKDYGRFLNLVDYYRYSKPPIRFSYLNRAPMTINSKVWDEVRNSGDILVEVLSFCLMPNHYHLLLRQVVNGGISNFLRIMQNAYARYFNTKYKRKGRLVQSEFQFGLIESDSQIDHVSRYIHLNPYSAHLIAIDHLDQYKYSSFIDYLGVQKHEFITTDFILSRFEVPDLYKEYVLDRADYQKELGYIKHLMLENHTPGV